MAEVLPVVFYVDIAIFDEHKNVHVQVMGVANLDYIWTVNRLLETVEAIKPGLSWTIQVRAPQR